MKGGTGGFISGPVVVADIEAMIDDAEKDFEDKLWRALALALFRTNICLVAEYILIFYEDPEEDRDLEKKLMKSGFSLL